jgi:hypothetical protein
MAMFEAVGNEDLEAILENKDAKNTKNSIKTALKGKNKDWLNRKQDPSESTCLPAVSWGKYSGILPDYTLHNCILRNFKIVERQIL